MKKIIAGIASLVVFLILSSCGATRRTPLVRVDNAAELESMIKSKNFTFVAESVQPLRGTFRTLTTLYTLRLSNDSLSSDLPYFGRATTAPLDPSNVSLKFDSQQFDYSVTESGKGKWDIMIKPRDFSEVSRMNMEVFSNGRASLNVTNATRDAISYNGFIAANAK